MTEWVDDNGNLHKLVDGREHVELAATQNLKLTIEFTEE